MPTNPIWQRIEAYKEKQNRIDDATCLRVRPEDEPAGWGGQVTWTAMSDQSWLMVTPTSRNASGH